MLRSSRLTAPSEVPDLTQKNSISVSRRGRVVDRKPAFESFDASKCASKCGEFVPSIVVILVCLLCYSNALTGEFVFDDAFAIVNNQDVTGDNHFNLWLHDFWGQDLSRSDSHKSYRPITTLTFRVNFLIFVSRLHIPCA